MVLWLHGLGWLRGMWWLLLLLTEGRYSFPGTTVSSASETDRYDMMLDVKTGETLKRSRRDRFY